MLLGNVVIFAILTCQSVWAQAIQLAIVELHPRSCSSRATLSGKQPGRLRVGPTASATTQAPWHPSIPIPIPIKMRVDSGDRSIVLVRP
jgi:hypothetical protein